MKILQFDICQVAQSGEAGWKPNSRAHQRWWDVASFVVLALLANEAVEKSLYHSKRHAIEQTQDRQI